MFFAALDRLGWCGDGPDVVGNGWEGLRFTGGDFLIYFSGFAIDRSKKYIKTIKNHKKIDAVNPQAAADNPPPHPPPGNNGVWG